MRTITLDTTRRRATCAGALAIVALLGALALPAAAQTSARVDAAASTRADLQTRAAELERAIAGADGDARRRLEGELALVRERLAEGDFRVGDRVVLDVRGDSALADTFAVRDGQVLRLPGTGDIGLKGVLRSELQTHLETELRRFIRDPEVEVTPLIRIGVLGEVGAPGFYSFRADEPVSDVIMAAGGPTQNADLERTKILRGDRALIENDNARDVIAQGRTLDQLNLRAGDQIFVEQRVRRNWWEIARNTIFIVGAALSIYGGSRIF